MPKHSSLVKKSINMDVIKNTKVTSKTGLTYNRRILKGLPFKLKIDQTEKNVTNGKSSKTAEIQNVPQNLRETIKKDSEKQTFECKNSIVQTEKYILAMTQRVTEFEAETQTDIQLDRPPSPLYRPRHTEVDSGTQINDGDLFNFDEEVAPILEVLVGKALEQSIKEITTESEIEALRIKREEYKHEQSLRILECQRLQASENRRNAELNRRNKEFRCLAFIRAQKQKKVIALQFAENLNMMQRWQIAQNHMIKEGFYSDHTEVATECLFFPLLKKHTTVQVHLLRNIKRTLWNGFPTNNHSKWDDYAIKFLRNRYAKRYKVLMKRVEAKEKLEEMKRRQYFELQGMQNADTILKERAYVAEMRKKQEAENISMEIEDINLLNNLEEYASIVSQDKHSEIEAISSHSVIEE